MAGLDSFGQAPTFKTPRRMACTVSGVNVSASRPSSRMGHQPRFISMTLPSGGGLTIRSMSAASIS